MGLTAQSVYVPFYAGITETPAEYQRGLETYSPDSAYWVFKQAGVLVDNTDQFGDLLKQTQQS